MEFYRFATLQDDGNWLCVELRFDDDEDAIAYGLRSRTANTCNLYKGELLLATFDGSGDPRPDKMFLASNSNSRLVKGPGEMETEVAYFHRRAAEERRRSMAGAGAIDDACLPSADYFDGLARAIEAKQRRQSFYDVKAICDGHRRPHPDWSRRHGL